ncbi:MAG: glutamate ABC transporter substrate-binding protein [Chloroflexota bacterium]|nr:glutamate ABC transporter substrate-binding protein [Chloroflexota bacterium]
MYKKFAPLMALVMAVAACSTPPGTGGSPAASPGTGGSPASSPAASSPAEPAASPTMVIVEGVSTPESIQAEGTLTCGVKFDVVGFGFRNPTNNEIEGFDADICREIAEEMGVEAELIEAVSANRIPFINERRVDLVISTFTINDERREQIDFSRPYYIAGQSILAKADNTEISSVEDLNGKNVCSATGSTSEANVREQAPEANLVLFATYTEAGQALDDGRCDAVSTDDVILFGLIDAYPDTELKGEPFTTEEYGIGMKKDSAELKAFVDDVLVAMDEDGRFEELWNANIGDYTDKEPVLPPES